jgi:hypothetical protein
MRNSLSLKALSRILLAHIIKKEGLKRTCSGMELRYKRGRGMSRKNNNRTGYSDGVIDAPLACSPV